MMNEPKFYSFKYTIDFENWLHSLKNAMAKAVIIKRIERAEKGNFGDHKSIGDGIYEMRIAIGTGYRVYYAQSGKTIYLLLCGGDKSSQQKDIMKAKEIWQKTKCSN